MEDKLASKQDLKELESQLEGFLSQLETKIDHSITQFDSKLAAVESKLTIRMGTMLAASIAVLTAIQKLV